jgi:molybdate transport system regulatory protein
MVRAVLRFRLDFPNGASIGPGKIDLLKAIEASGSLTQAAKSIKLSYRRAWLLVKDLNDAFTRPVILATTGGKTGGGAEITAFGKRLVEVYEAADRQFQNYASANLKELSRVLSPDYLHASNPVQPKIPGRRARE